MNSLGPELYIDESDSSLKPLKMTSLKQLEKNIKQLAKVQVSDEPFISCYLSIQPGGFSWHQTLEKKAALYRRTLRGKALEDFEECLDKIKRWLRSDLLPTTRGVAIFTRGSHGGKFWLPMQFSVSVPNIISTYPTPNLYELIKLKDKYHSYILLIAKQNHAYIIEVNLGDATIQAWIENPGLYKNVGTEWSKLHYQVNKSKRGNKYHQEKIKIIRRLMRENNLSHLVIAGDAETIKDFKNIMPLDLRKKCIDVIPALDTVEPCDIVNATLSSFIDYEEQVSQDVADKLMKQLNGQNLAVAGTKDTFDALLWGEVDTLVVSNYYNPDPGWRCKDCKQVGFNLPLNAVCPSCRHQSIVPINLKEAILRLASQQDIGIEMVEESELLLAVGGVGCLLRCR